MTADWPTKKTISVVVDTAGWFDDHAQQLVAKLRASGHTSWFVRSQEEVVEGDVAFFLSCMRITPPHILARNGWNFVVHASDLPKGRGFSPVVWQVLEGATEIPVSMIVMTEEVDAGKIAMRRRFALAGHELNEEIRGVLGNTVVEMCLEMAERSSAPDLQPQLGSPTWYQRRYPSDSQLDPARTIAEQFNLLRVVDNERYPAFFDLHGHRYVLRIEDAGPSPDSTIKKAP